MSKIRRMSEWSFSPPTLSDLPIDANENDSRRGNVAGAVFSACRDVDIRQFIYFYLGQNSCSSESSHRFGTNDRPGI
jgi:hypothetical protein